MMSHRPFARIAVILIAALVAPSTVFAQSSAQRVTLAQFKKLVWLAGSWRGSGGNYPSFFEDYRVINDSTIRMRSLSDSTFRTAKDSSTIELRNGTIASRDVTGPGTPAIAVTDTSVQFRRPGATSGGWTFTRISADEWRATIHPANPGAQPTIYVMRKVRN